MWKEIRRNESYILSTDFSTKWENLTFGWSLFCFQNAFSFWVLFEVRFAVSCQLRFLTQFMCVFSVEFHSVDPKSEGTVRRKKIPVLGLEPTSEILASGPWWFLSHFLWAPNQRYRASLWVQKCTSLGFGGTSF